MSHLLRKKVHKQKRSQSTVLWLRFYVTFVLLHDAKAWMPYPGRLCDLQAFQPAGNSVRMVEQPDTIIEQDRREVDMYFFEQTSLDLLLRHTRCGDHNVLSPAAAFACSAALSTQSVTNVKGILP